jgi:hypothetical protein
MWGQILLPLILPYIPEFIPLFLCLFYFVFHLFSLEALVSKGHTWQSAWRFARGIWYVE